MESVERVAVLHGFTVVGDDIQTSARVQQQLGQPIECVVADVVPWELLEVDSILAILFTDHLGEDRVGLVAAADDRHAGRRRLHDRQTASFGLTGKDDKVGEVMEALEATRQEAIIMFVADHGDMLGERGLWYKMKEMRFSYQGCGAQINFQVSLLRYNQCLWV